MRLVRTSSTKSPTSLRRTRTASGARFWSSTTAISRRFGAPPPRSAAVSCKAHHLHNHRRMPLAGTSVPPRKTGVGRRSGGLRHWPRCSPGPPPSEHPPRRATGPQIHKPNHSHDRLMTPLPGLVPLVSQARRHRHPPYRRLWLPQTKGAVDDGGGDQGADGAHGVDFGLWPDRDRPRAHRLSF